MQFKSFMQSELSLLHLETISVINKNRLQNDLLYSHEFYYRNRRS
jgi:hypothetical protein